MCDVVSFELELSTNNEHLSVDGSVRVEIGEKIAGKIFAAEQFAASMGAENAVSEVRYDFLADWPESSSSEDSVERLGVITNFESSELVILFARGRILEIRVQSLDKYSDSDVHSQAMDIERIRQAFPQA